METNLQNWSTGKRLTVGTGGVTEGYACKLTSSLTMVACDDTDDIPIGLAAATYSAGDEGIFYPIGDPQEQWVGVTAAVTVGAKLVLDPATGRYAASTSTGAIITAIALTATASSGYAKVKFCQPTINIAE
jgi:hypothetical protein